MKNSTLNNDCFDYLVKAKQDVMLAKAFMEREMFAESHVYFCNSIKLSGKYISLCFDPATYYPHEEEWDHYDFMNLYTTPFMQALKVSGEYTGLTSKMMVSDSIPLRGRYLVSSLNRRHRVKTVSRQRQQSAAEALLNFHRLHSKVMSPGMVMVRGKRLGDIRDRVERECEEHLDRINDYGLCMSVQAILSSVFCNGCNNYDFHRAALKLLSIRKNYAMLIKWQLWCIDLLYEDFVNNYPHYHNVRVDAKLAYA